MMKEALLVVPLAVQAEQAPPRPSSPVEGASRAVAAIGPETVEGRELPVADFLEPVEYNWTEAGFEARQALKRLSEEAHADH